MLEMTVLANHNVDYRYTRNDDRSNWTVHARCVTIHPHFANRSHRSDNSTTGSHDSILHPTIETVWEVSNHNHQYKKHRIAIYSGPEHVQAILHMSMSLPSDTSVPPPPLQPQGNSNNNNNSPSLLPSSSVLAWVHFRSDNETNQHKVLCCLCNPNSLYIWDVFPENNAGIHSDSTISIPSEGWMITLPFECRTIIPIDDGGLLLQRLPDVEDSMAHDYNKTQQPTNYLNSFAGSQTFNDDGFVLLGPPSTWKHKLQQPSATNSKSDTNVVTLPITNTFAQPPDVQQHQLQTTTILQQPVISLFTLHHPLEDVVPVMSLSSEIAANCDPVSDVFEQVVWIGTAEWMHSGNNESQSHKYNITSHAQIMVTYHTMEHRHAIYYLTGAPSPPVIPPLYEQTRQQKQHDKQKRKSPMNNDTKNFGPMRDIVDLSIDDDDADATDASNHLNMVFDMDGNDDDPPDALFGRTMAPFLDKPKVDHNVALADALGVAHSGHRFRPSSSSPRLQQQQQPYLPMGSASSGGGNHPSFRTKIPQPEYPSHSGFFSPSVGMNANTGSFPLNVDVSHHTNPTPSQSTQSTGFFHSKLMNALHPRIAIRCLYRENPSASSTIPCARTVCLVSNVAATGTLVLAILRGDNILVLYSLLPGLISGEQLNDHDMRSEGIIGVQILTSIPLVASMVPICAFPTPLRSHCTFHPPLTQLDCSYSVWTTDLLALHENGRNCTLYRSNIPISENVVDTNEGIDVSKLQMVGLSDSVLSTYSVYFQEKGMLHNSLMKRCQLSMSLQTKSCITERVLSCLDCTMYETDKSMNMRCIQLILKIRFDCHRYYAAISKMQLSNNLPTSERLLFEILQVIIVQVLHCHLNGSKKQSMEESSGILPAKTNGNSAWETLLNSDFHQMRTSELQSYIPALEEKSMVSIIDWTATIQSMQSSIGSLAIHDLQQNESWKEIPLFSCVFDSIHLLYEDTKLSAQHSGTELSYLANLLTKLTEMAQQQGQTVSADIFLKHYRNENISEKNSNSQFRNSDSNFKWTSFTSPPSIFYCAQNMLQNIGDRAAMCVTYGNSVDWNTINPVCAKTRLVLRILPFLRIGNTHHDDDMRVVQMLVEEGFTSTSMIREEFSFGVSVPILEVLYRCKCSAEQVDVPGWSSEAWILVGRRDLAMNYTASQTTLYAEYDRLLSSGATDDTQDESDDGLGDVERNAAIIFPEDNRVHEAARLLSSSRPIFLRVARAVEVSDHDFERLKQNRLLVLSCRVLALPTGRGMVTIGRFSPIPTEPLPIPSLCLKGRIPPTNATITLDISDCPTDMTVWPEFHNGVAAGLRLPVKGDPYHASVAIPRTWILYNRPPANKTPVPAPQDNGDDANAAAQTQSYSHGGFLLALGLQGHLSALDMSDVYEYLTQGCATTTVGVLLGMAANKRGTCDLSVSKMLCLHIPSLIPQHFSAIDVASIVQTSAVFGAGLLFQGSSHRMMTEFLLNEIGKRPDADINTSDRESYILACGLALGTVNLCLGETISTDSRRVGLADLRIEERLIRYIVGGVDKDEVERTRESNDRFSLPNSMTGSDSEKCSTIYESNLINTSVTSPGATLALGLIYMKTNNKAVAGALTLPDTHFLLEFVRPDFLGFRVISKALIMWDEVEASSIWVDEQIPTVVRAAYEQIGIAARAAFNTRWPTANRSQVEEYDRRAIKQIYIHVVSSACFAMGLRFAGTGDPNAKEVIMARVKELHGLREATDPVSSVIRPETPILESCLGCAAIALAMVLAGTGDLDALRVFKILRWRCDNDSQYGIHMIFGMCVGLLFLGGGACTLGRDPADIAALITAFFPRFPVSTADNQYHLQALRHLYTLAIKRTELRTTDVDTKENVQVMVQISASNSNMDASECRLPCLLRNSGNPHQELRVISDNFYPIKLDLSKQNGMYSFFVQRRYAMEYNSFSVASSSRAVGSSIAPLSLSSHPYLRAFSEYFQDGMTSKRKQFESGDDQLLKGEFVARVLSACQKSDSPEDILPLYLNVWYCATQIRNMNQVARACFLWEIRLLQTFYQHGLIRSNSHLLDAELLLPLLFECTGRHFY